MKEASTFYYNKGSEFKVQGEIMRFFKKAVNRSFYINFIFL